MNKRVPVKQTVRKCGSLDSASDRSISPNDISEVKENKPNILLQRQPVKRATKNEGVKTGITKPRTNSKSAQKIAKPATPTKAIKSQNLTNGRLLSPRSTTTTTRQKAKTEKADNTTGPNWKVPSAGAGIGKPSPIRPLPGRGGPKKLKKVHNPPSLFSLCKTAVATIIPHPEVDEEAKDFLKRRLFGQAIMGTVWATLTKETKKSRISIETLISERDGLSAELTELKATLDSQISSLTSQHEATLRKTTSTLVNQHDKEVKRLTEEYETTIADLRSQLSLIEDKHLGELSEVRETHAREIADLHRDHESQRNQLIRDHDAEVLRLEGTQKDLEEQNEHLDSQLREKDENCEREVQIQLEQQVARYATINAELQSLNDVIDIKTKENKKLQKEIAEMSFKVEEVGVLRHELASLRDNNEQLRATISMKTESERNLNITQEKLCQKIMARESDKKNISQKCEELQFKLEAYEDFVKQHNLQENLGVFSPSLFSTPLNSPIRHNSDYESAAETTPLPRNTKAMSKVRLFGASDGTAEILPLND